MTENRYEKHCPCTVSELREFRKLGEIEGTILEEAAAAKETLERNQWILTAEKSGLLRLYFSLQIMMLFPSALMLYRSSR